MTEDTVEYWKARSGTLQAERGELNIQIERWRLVGKNAVEAVEAERDELRRIASDLSGEITALGTALANERRKVGELVEAVQEDFDLAHGLIQEAKGVEPNGGYATDHLDAAEGHLDNIEKAIRALATTQSPASGGEVCRNCKLVMTPDVAKDMPPCRGGYGTHDFATLPEPLRAGEGLEERRILTQMLGDCREALANLSLAETEYRRAHDLKGDGSPEAGRAWDLMRRASQRAQKLLVVQTPPAPTERGDGVSREDLLPIVIRWMPAGADPQRAVSLTDAILALFAEGGE